MNAPARSALRTLSAQFCRCKGGSSEEWLERQRKDPYVNKANRENYRCRSAYKLLEINEKVRFLRPGMLVVDIGAAPGSWSQIAVREVNSDGKDSKKPKGAVFSIDMRFIYPIEGATLFSNCDFETEEAQNALKEALNGAKVDAVISDMAPNSTGVKELDQDKIIGLCYKAFRFAAQVSRTDACFLVKVWDGSEASVLELDLGRFYRSVKVIKPAASRSDSSEKFLFAKGFKGLA